MSGLRVGAAYVDIHGRLARDFDRDVEREGSSRLGAVGSKLGGVLAGGIATAGVAAGAALVKGLSDAIGNEQVGDKLSAQLGATGAFAEEMGGIAGSLYADAYGDSLGTVNDALKNVWQSGLVSEDASTEAIEAMTAKALDFTTTFEQDMAMTTAAVGQMLRTGLVSDADQAFDLLTRGAQQGADKAGDLVETFNEYGTQFRQIGLDGATAMGLLTQGVQAGARDADIVADSLKEFAIRAQDGSEATAAGFDLIGLSAEEMGAAVARGGPDAAAALDQTLDKLREMEDPALQAQAAVALFGTQSEDLQDALYSLDPSTAVAGLGNIEGAADRAAATLNDNLGTRIESLKRRGLQALASFIGDTVVPAVDSMLPVVERVVGGIVQKWPEIQAAVMPVIEKIVAIIEQKWPQIAEVIESVMVTVSTLIAGGLELVEVLWTNFGAYVLEFISSTFDAVMKVIGGALEIVQGIVETVLGIITGDWSRAWEGVKMILSGAWDVIVGIFDAAFARVKLVIQVGLDIVKGIFSGALDAVKSTVSGGIDSVVGFFDGIGGRISRVAGDVFGFLWTSFKEAINLVLKGWNALEFKIPGFDPPGPGPSFGGFTLGLPNVPLLAAGGDVTRAGLAIVGDDGAELLDLPAGARVTPLDTAEMVAGAARGRGGVTIERLEVPTAADATADEVVDAIGAKLGWKLTTRRDR
jgi:phage-related minor tail protein